MEAQIDEWALLQEELFLAAVHEAGGSVNENGRIVGVDDREEEQDDSSIRNSIKKTSGMPYHVQLKQIENGKECISVG